MTTRRIAILGGGMAALTTALRLTDTAERRGRHEVHVYQMGWRLGGKGASSRSFEPSGEERIHEHGLHVLFGFYENSFRALRETFAEAADLGWPFTFDDVLEPHAPLVMGERRSAGWKTDWTIDLPALPGEPGVPGEHDRQRVDWRSDLFALGRITARMIFQRPDAGPLGERFAIHEPLIRTHAHLDRPLDPGAGLGPAGLRLLGPEATETTVEAGFADVLTELRGPNEKWFDAGEDLRRWALMLELATILGKAILSDLPKAEGDWFALDELDFRDWLRSHGASERVVRSAPVDGLYDAAYCSPGTTYGAGSFAHALIASLTRRKGHAIYHMRAGMGDVVFAPLYRVLKERGVRFHFFHRVEALHLDESGTAIGGVEIARQARTIGGTDYEPLVRTTDGHWAWPDAPLHDQLEDGAAIARHELENWWDDHELDRIALRARDGTDADDDLAFDDLVLAISVGAFPDICRELMEDAENPAFGAMVDALQTTLTRSAQLWLSPPLDELGWSGGSPILIPFAKPFDTWSDMSHLLATEKSASARCLAYLTSSLPDPEPSPPKGVDPAYPHRLRELVRAQVRAWLETSSSRLWPGAHDDGFRYALLDAPAGTTGRERLDAQWFIAADNPSDRYNLAVRGSNRYRLHADESGYANLVLAGDWTRTALSLGCLEAATLSGIHAATAIDPSIDGPVHDWLTPLRTAEHARAARGAAHTVRRTARFIRREGDLIAPPPVDLSVKTWVFALDADGARIQTLCDRELNLCDGHEFRPASRTTPLVFFYASDLDNGVPGGSVEERDFGFWIPLVHRFEADGAIEEELVVYAPHLWVDSSPALVNGLTVFGFPKQIGHMTIPAPGTSTPRFVLRADLVPTHGAPTRSDTLVEAAGTAPLPSGDGPGPGDLWRLIREALELLGGDADWREAAGLYESKGMRQVSLKQLLEADGSFDAAHQSLVEVDFRTNTFEHLHVLEGDWELAVRHAFTPDLVRNLGLRTRSYDSSPWPRHLIDARFGVSLAFGATVLPGRTLCRRA